MSILSQTLFFLILSIILCSTHVDSVGVEWTSSSFGYWEEPSNWNTSSVPTASDDVILPNLGNPYTVFVGGYAVDPLRRPVQANSLFISDQVTFDLLGLLQVATTITSYGTISLFQPKSAPTYTVLSAETSIDCFAGSISGIGTIQTPSLVCFF